MSEEARTAEQHTAPAVPAATVTDDLTVDLLVEEVSIDGMCGVY